MSPQENEESPSATGSPPGDSPSGSPASPNWSALRVSMKYAFT